MYQDRYWRITFFFLVGPQGLFQICKAILFTQQGAEPHEKKCVFQCGAAVMPPTSKMSQLPSSR